MLCFRFVSAAVYPLQMSETDRPVEQLWFIATNFQELISYLKAGSTVSWVEFKFFFRDLLSPADD